MSVDIQGAMIEGSQEAAEGPSLPIDLSDKMENLSLLGGLLQIEGDLDAEMERQRSVRKQVCASLVEKIQQEHDRVEAVRQSLAEERTALDEISAVIQRREEALKEIERYREMARGGVISFDSGGTLFKVSTDVLEASPSPNFFHGILRNRMEAAEAHRLSLKEFLAKEPPTYVDCEPKVFELILRYLRHRGPKDLKTILSVPEKLRAVVRDQAHSWGLDELVELLTDASALVELFTPRDAAMKEEEDSVRRELVRNQRGAVPRATGLLMNVFSQPETFQADSPRYPLLFTHVRHFFSGLHAGELCIVPTEERFKATFHQMTGGLLQGVDWNNMIVAGGSVLAALLRPPEWATRVPPEVPPGRETDPWWAASVSDRQHLANAHAANPRDIDKTDWVASGARDMEIYLSRRIMLSDLISYRVGFKDWYGPSRLFGHPKERVLKPPANGFAEMDIDIFLYGLKPHEATAKLCQIINSIASVQGPELVIVRGQHAVTIIPKSVEVPYFQVILRIYSCPAEVLIGFDLDSCCVAYDGSHVWCTPRFHRAVVNRMNLVDPSRQSTSYEHRLMKYAKRGFRVAVPGFDRMKVDAGVFLKRAKDLKGLAKLLKLEEVDCLSRPVYLTAEHTRKARKEIGSIEPTSDYSGGMVHLRQYKEQKENLKALVGVAWALMSSGTPVPFVFAKTLNELGDVLDAHGVLARNRWATDGLQKSRDPWFADATCNHDMQLSIPVQITWMVDNPGTQLATGSFHPLEADWTAEAYGTEAQ